MTANLHDPKFYRTHLLDGGNCVVRWDELNRSPSNLEPLAMIFDSSDDAERELTAALDAVRQARGIPVAEAVQVAEDAA